MSFIQNPSFEGEIAPWKTISGTVSLSLHSDPSIARSGTQMLSATPSRAGDSFGQDIDLSYLASPPYPTKLQSISCFAWIRTLDTPSSPAPGIYQPLSGRFCDLAAHESVRHSAATQRGEQLYSGPSMAAHYLRYGLLELRHSPYRVLLGLGLLDRGDGGSCAH